jgi:uncharacterized membrane protein
VILLLNELLNFFGRAICHQLDARSLHISGEVMAVCARDTGIYIGIFSTLLYLHFSKQKQNVTIPSIKVSFLLLLFLVPLIIDGLGSYTQLFDSNNTRRLMTGISFGFVLPYFIYPLLSKKSLEHGSVPVIKKSYDFLVPLAGSVILGGLVYAGQPSHLVLNTFIIVTVIAWFSILASFLFPFILRLKIKLLVSLIASLAFLSFLSIIHISILS